MELRHRVGQMERDVKILQALGYVPGQSAGVGQNLIDAQDVGPLQRQPPGHNQADVTRPENHNFRSTMVL